MVSLEKSILMKWSEVKWKPLSRVWLFATPWTVQNSPDQNTVQNPPGQNTAQNSPGQNTVQNSPGQNTGVGSLSLLQGIFSTQGSNPGLLHCRQILYQLSHNTNSTLFIPSLPGNGIERTVFNSFYETSIYLSSEPEKEYKKQNKSKAKNQQL